MIVALTVPITIACALFAEDLISVFLGPKWKDAAGIFRLLAPTILVFGIANPLGWLLPSIGMVGRSLKMTLFIAPILITGYVIGLPYGPQGVALAYSAVMLLWVFPVIAWSVKGTVISVRDLLLAISRPLASSTVAAVLAFGVRFFYGQWMSPLPRLVLEGTVLLVAYLGMLMFVAGQKSFYLDLLRGLKSTPSLKDETLVSV